MEDIILTNKEAWDKVKYVAKHPMVVIPIIIGLASLIIAIIVDNKFVETLFMAISSIGLGVAINYYSFYYKDLSAFNRLNMEIKEMDKEKAIFKEKSKITVERLMSLSRKIVDHCNDKGITLTEFEHSLLREISSIKDTFKEYHEADIEMDKRAYINQSNYAGKNPTTEEKIKSLNTLTYLQYNGLTIPTGSGNWDKAVEQTYSFQQNQFMGSGGLTNEPTFKQDS